jgi:hypothetical protein
MLKQIQECERGMKESEGGGEFKHDTFDTLQEPL